MTSHACTDNKRELKNWLLEMVILSHKHRPLDGGPLPKSCLNCLLVVEFNFPTLCLAYPQRE